MKIYTEEQVSLAINVAKANPEQAYLILAMLKPIKLPSDEEINNKSKLYGYAWEIYYKGAKWMRDKIQGGNK